MPFWFRMERGRRAARCLGHPDQPHRQYPIRQTGAEGTDLSKSLRDTVALPQHPHQRKSKRGFPLLLPRSQRGSSTRELQTPQLHENCHTQAVTAEGQVGPRETQQVSRQCAEEYVRSSTARNTFSGARAGTKSSGS